MEHDKEEMNMGKS